MRLYNALFWPVWYKPAGQCFPDCGVWVSVDFLSKYKILWGETRAHGVIHERKKSSKQESNQSVSFYFFLICLSANLYSCGYVHDFTKFQIAKVFSYSKVSVKIWMFMKGFQNLLFSSYLFTLQWKSWKFNLFKVAVFVGKKKSSTSFSPLHVSVRYIL